VARPAIPTAPAIVVEGEPVTMPFGDLTVDSGKLVRWVVPDGAAVAKGDFVAEIETDKAVVEIEAPATGRLRHIVTQEGSTVKMGGTIGSVLP
jgi:2-oxoisovalerate dehydrogenase E1 component